MHTGNINYYNGFSCILKILIQTVTFSAHQVCNLLLNRFVMRIINNEASSQNEVYYFLATSQYLGDKRSSYGQMLQFSMSLKVPPLPTTVIYPTVVPPLNNTGNTTSNVTVTMAPVTVTLVTYEELMVNSTRGDVRLTGKHTSFSIVTKLPSWPGTTKTEYQVNYVHVLFLKISCLNVHLYMNECFI